MRTQGESSSTAKWHPAVHHNERGSEGGTVHSSSKPPQNVSLGEERGLDDPVGLSISTRLPNIGFPADGEYSCGSVSGLRGTQSPMHGLKCRGYEALWASAAHSLRVACSGGSPTLPCAPPILECDRGRSPRHPCEGELVPDGPRGGRRRASVERKLPRRAR
jgi:hypothetical protein